MTPVWFLWVGWTRVLLVVDILVVPELFGTKNGLGELLATIK